MSKMLLLFNSSTFKIQKLKIWSHFFFMFYRIRMVAGFCFAFRLCVINRRPHQVRMLYQGAASWLLCRAVLGFRNGQASAMSERKCWGPFSRRRSCSFIKMCNNPIFLPHRQVLRDKCNPLPKSLTYSWRLFHT